MIDSRLLRQTIKDKGLKYQFVAKHLGITPYALQMKIDNVNEFKGSEIASFTKLLGITKSQRDSIFFAGFVD